MSCFDASGRIFMEHSPWADSNMPYYIMSRQHQGRRGPWSEKINRLQVGAERETASETEKDIMSKVVRVAVTGAAGQVAYSMLGRLASGEIFGPSTQVILQLLEITPAMPTLEGVVMELEDCSFPTLKEAIP